MEQQTQSQLPIQTPKKKSKKFLIILIIILAVIVIFGGAILTRAGAIPNYLDIELLCSENGPGWTIGGGGPIKKPVIYLYPEEQQQVDVKLNLQGELFATYPAYKDGWSIIAHPDGKIINQSDNRQYSYLFWEAINKDANYDLSTGFVVKGPDTVEFLQDKLAKLGLTPREYNEFIVYWFPEMQNNKYNLIHFATKEEYDDRAVLDITPEPDSLLRVFMVFKKLDNKIEIESQEIKPFERKGFAVVEWGGTEIK